MKRITLLAVSCFFILSSFASGTSLIVPSKKASEIMVSVGKSGQKVSLLDLTTMKAKQFEALSGKKMSLIDKLGFKIAQKEIRKNINPDQTINMKGMQSMTKKMAKKAMSADAHHYLHLWILFLIVAIVLGIIGIFVPFIWILSLLAWIGAVIFFILWLVNMA